MAQNIARQLYDAVSTGNVSTARELLTEHPEYRNPNPSSPNPNVEVLYWLQTAISNNQFDMVTMLLDLGYKINAIAMPEEVTPLISSINDASLKMIRFLLSRGADATIGRGFFAAINRDTEECDDDERLEIVKLLVKHGADINRVFNWIGDDSILFTPLSYAISSGKEQIAEYLKSLGATMPPQRQKPPEQPVVAFFQKNFGKVLDRSLIEIVPTTDPPIAIHVIRPTKSHNLLTLFTRPKKSRNVLTLFTTGMSDRAMTVPDGEEEYQFAELFIELPADWPLTDKALADPNFGWPIQWLRQVAGYPHANETWLGGPVTIIANGEPPERLTPKCPFTSLLIIVGHSFTTDDGRTIQLYRLLPLYTEERALEMSQGVGELMRRFDTHNISTTVDLQRTNVALKSKK